MTPLDLITRSMRLLGVANIDEGPIEAAEAQDGLTALNTLIEALELEPNCLFTSTRALYALVPGKQAYAIGPTAAAPDWTGPRPTYLDAAGLVLPNVDPTQALERELHVIRTDKEWARVRLKGLASTLPTAVYYEADFPNGQLAFWPAPTASNNVALYTRTAIAQFSGLAQVISMPPGYARMLAYNLAIDFAPEFDTEPSDVVVAIAEESKMLVKRKNVSIEALRSEDFASHGAGFNWLDGEPV